MAAEDDFERRMLAMLLETGSPAAFPKGMMLAAAAIRGEDWEGADGLLRLLVAGPVPDDQAEPMAQLASDLGAAMLKQGKEERALAWFENAASLAPRNSKIRSNLAAARIRLGRFTDAASAIDAALEANPNDCDALALMGNLAHAEGRLEDARRAFETLLRCAPDNQAARIDLAELLKDIGLFDKALRTLSAAKESPQTLSAEGNIRKAMGDDKAAGHAYEKAFSLRPDPAIRAKRALLLPVIADGMDDIANCRQGLAQRLEEMIADGVAIDDPERDVGTTLFHLAYHGANDRPLMELAARFWRGACPALSFTAGHVANWRPGKKLRIGFISRHLNAHTMAKLNRGVIADLDRRRFEVFVFQIGKQDGTALEIAATADHAARLNGSLDAMRETIAEARLDLVYYPDIGMEPTTYFLAFARLAPVQIVACGHPDTTGLDTLDAFISGDPLDAPSAQAHYAEPLLRLSGFPFYMRKPPVGDVRADRNKLGLPLDKKLYVCPQSLFKFHPEFDAMLAGILKADANGRLVLIEQLHPLVTDKLKNRLRLSIPDIDARLIVLNRMPPKDFMTLLVSSDAVLDPWRFGGGSSSLEAFAMGVPVVTRPGAFLRERVTMAAYAKIGMEELCATDAKHYENLAVRLANDQAWKTGLSAKLQKRAPGLFLDKAELMLMEEAFIMLAEAKLNQATAT